MTIAAASVSWYLFEGPINRLKERIPRDAKAPAEPTRIDGEGAAA
jgi:hypothetical protein